MISTPKAPPGFAPINDEATYQKMANGTQRAVYELLHMIHATNGEHLAEGGDVAAAGDGGPVIAGCVGGLLQFWMDGDVPPEELYEIIKDQLDVLIPQERMKRAEEEVGAVGKGAA